MKPGMFVSPKFSFDIGKLIAIDGSQAIVRFFYAITKQEDQTYMLDQIDRAYPHPHTRAYVLIDDEWHVGRITNYDLQEDKTIE